MSTRSGKTSLPLDLLSPDDLQLYLVTYFLVLQATEEVVLILNGVAIHASDYVVDADVAICQALTEKRGRAFF